MNLKVEVKRSYEDMRNANNGAGRMAFKNGII